MSYQHIFFYPLMAFGRINLYAQAPRVRVRGKGYGGVRGVTITSNPEPLTTP